MIKSAMLIAAMAFGEVAPDELVAIRCTGTVTATSKTRAGTDKYPFDAILILNEHDRSVTRWNAELGRDEPLCAIPSSGCVYDFGPAMVKIGSDVSTGSYTLGWINRTMGTYNALVVAGGNEASTFAKCAKVPVPTFDRGRRAF